MSKSILEVHNLSKAFRVTTHSGMRESASAVANISFAIKHGETVGIVGESGCGKSTLAKLILRLLQPDTGQVFYKGKDILTMGKSQFRSLRPEIQLIFQNSYDCMNPKMSIQALLLEGMLEHKLCRNKKQALERMKETLYECGLEPDCLTRYPHEFSGGQLQRIAIARVLLLKPHLIIADEVVSALDVPVQGQILELFLQLKQKLNLSLLFISHDLAVVRKICDRIIVMEKGEIVESGRTEEVFKNPHHNYTHKLISSIMDFSYA